MDHEKSLMSRVIAKCLDLLLPGGGFVYEATEHVVKNVYHNFDTLNYHFPFIPDDPQLLSNLSEQEKNNIMIEKKEHMYNIGAMYIRSYYLSYMPEKAIDYFTQAAEANYPPALTALGICYQLGKGKMKNYVQAMKYYEKATEFSYSPSLLYLANMLHKGYGSSSNIEKALHYYQEASKLGNNIASYELAKIYDEGNGIEQSDTNAFFWYTVAAKQHNTKAMTNLGVMYEFGQGTKRDLNAAKMWYTRAVNNGCSKAEEHLKRL